MYSDSSTIQILVQLKETTPEDEEDDEDDNDSPGIPGYELLTIMSAMGLTIVIIIRRRKKIQ